MNMTKLIYAVYFAGLAIWQFPLLYSLYLTVRNRIQIRRNLKHMTDDERLKQYGSFSEHVNIAIEGADMKKLFNNPETFYLVSAILFIGTAAIAALVVEPTMALCFGSFMGALPYCSIMARLYSQRVTRSREGDVLVQELLNNYKIHMYNMKEAIEITAFTIEGAPGAKRILLNLAKGLNNAVTEKEVEKLLSVFRYSIDTAWGNVLSSNIFFAYIHGIRVDQALEDLLSSITKSRKVIEHGKRENNEARLMLKYLAPISFLLSIIGACKYFDFTIAKFIKYQLGTALGLKWFMIMVMFYVAGILINGFLSREKMDI